MTHDPQTAAGRARSARAKAALPYVSAADARALLSGVGDFFWILYAQKRRLCAYTALLLFSIGLLGAMHWHYYWSLSHQVDRSSIVRVGVEMAPVDLTRPWARQDTFSTGGTGSIIDGHRILTAAHVVDDAVEIAVTRADGGDTFDATVYAISHEVDLAVLAVDDDHFFHGATPLEIQERPHGDDELVAYGYPGSEMEYTIGRFLEVHRSAYVTSDHRNLKYTVGSPIEPGYSGGPLAWNGRIAGVLIEGNDSEGTAHAVPASVIRHFLEDVEDGTVDGTAALIGAWQSMENPQIRNYYGLPDGQSGVIVRSVMRTRAGRPRLLPGDIIIAVDGTDVANDGTVPVELSSRVSFEYLIDRKQAGDTVTVDILRDRVPLTVEIPLIDTGKDRTRLVRYLGNESPSYLVVGGFVFSTLTADYVRDFDTDADTYRIWVHQAGLADTYRTLDEIRDEAVVLVRLLPDATTEGYDNCLGHVVTHVNGLWIGNMRELVKGFEEGLGDHHLIGLQPDDMEIVISRAVLGDRQQAILDQYDIPADRSPDLAVATARE